MSTRLDQAVEETATGRPITSREQLLGTLEGVRCGKIKVDDAAKRLERWIDAHAQNSLALFKGIRP